MYLLCNVPESPNPDAIRGECRSDLDPTRSTSLSPQNPTPRHATHQRKQQLPLGQGATNTSPDPRLHAPQTSRWERGPGGLGAPHGVPSPGLQRGSRERAGLCLGTTLVLLRGVVMNREGGADGVRTSDLVFLAFSRRSKRGDDRGELLPLLPGLVLL